MPVPVLLSGCVSSCRALLPLRRRRCWLRLLAALLLSPGSRSAAGGGAALLLLAAALAVGVLGPSASEAAAAGRLSSVTLAPRAPVQQAQEGGPAQRVRRCALFHSVAQPPDVATRHTHAAMCQMYAAPVSASTDQQVRPPSSLPPLTWCWLPLRHPQLLHRMLGCSQRVTNLQLTTWLALCCTVCIAG